MAPIFFFLNFFCTNLICLVKWLGETRVRPLVVDSGGSKEKIAAVKRWGAAQGQIVNPILIISYESLRTYSKYLRKSPIGMLLCDEGHRLKNGGKEIIIKKKKQDSVVEIY